MAMAKTDHSERTPRHVKRAATKGLIQLSLGEHQPQRQSGSVFVVRLGGERSVEVPSDFDEVALGRLLTVLERC